jgi:hypothetical protein
MTALAYLVKRGHPPRVYMSRGRAMMAKARLADGFAWDVVDNPPATTTQSATPVRLTPLAHRLVAAADVRMGEIASDIVEERPAPKRSNYHSYLRPPGDRETPAKALVAAPKGAQYLLANSLILFAAVLDTRRAYDFAMANMPAARAADNRGAR